MKFLFSIRPCLQLLFFLTISVSLVPQYLFAEKNTGNIAHHTIALSFALDKAMLEATSRIEIPARDSLRLDVHHLRITGAVLESREQTPRQVVSRNGKIILAAKPYARTLYLSWQFHATPPDTLISKKGITLTGIWHPLAKQDMLFTLKADLPDGFAGISEGRVTTVHRKKAGNTLQATVDFPLPTLHFVAGPYRIHQKKTGNITVYSYFFPEDDHLAHGYIDKAALFIEHYQKLIGPFPYPSYAIVENRFPTGYGMPGFTLLGQAVVRLPFIKETSLGHEIVHSWFGNAVGIAKDSGNWCEGLTTYLADHDFAQNKGAGSAYRKKQILRYLDYVHQDNSMTLADFMGAGHSGPMNRKLRAIGYDRGSMLFHMLKLEIGDKAFFKGLRTLYQEKKFDRASWQDIETIFSQAASKDLSVFFQQWLHRADIPDLIVDKASFRQEQDGTMVRFHLVQKNTSPFLLRVPVSITTMTGEKKMLLTLKKADQEFSIAVDALPVQLRVDPDYDILRSLADDEIPATWARFLGARNKILLLPDDTEEAAKYSHLVDTLRATGAQILHAHEFNASKLGQSSILFAGPSGFRQSLFAQYSPPRQGFILKMKKNPLNRQETMVLVDASTADEVRLAARKLSHYGQYSVLLFQKGQLVRKEIEKTAQGLRIDLLPLPAGIPTRAVQDFTSIIEDISNSRVIYAGETHTAYGDHILQLQIIQALYASNKNLALGMEMFPRSSQPALDGYIDGTISSEKEFLDASRYFSVWGFDYRYYRGIIHFARTHHIPIIALNIEKKIVSKVFKEGNMDSLADEERKQIPPNRALTLPGYSKRLQKIYSMHRSSPHAAPRQFSGFLQAQAIWDETMAESISTYLQKNPDRQMIIIAGAGHVYKDSAIPPRVARRMPGIRQSVLISNNGFDTGLETGKAVDYLIFTEEVKLPPAPKIGIILEERKKKTNGEESEVIITGLSPHGNGAKSGLQKGDIILRIDNQPVRAISDIRYALLDKADKETVIISIKREQPLGSTKEMNIPVQLSLFPKLQKLAFCQSCGRDAAYI